MATDPEAILAQLKEIHDQLTRDPSLPSSPAFLAKLQGVAGSVKAAAQEAKAKVEADIHATAADMRAKAAAMKPPAPPAPAAKAEAFPQPWEDHQGLDAAKLQGMVEALQQLGRRKH